MRELSFKRVKMTEVTWPVKGERKTWAQMLRASALALCLAILLPLHRSGCDYWHALQKEGPSLSVIIKWPLPLYGLTGLFSPVGLHNRSFRISLKADSMSVQVAYDTNVHAMTFFHSVGKFQSFLLFYEMLFLFILYMTSAMFIIRNLVIQRSNTEEK